MSKIHLARAIVAVGTLIVVAAGPVRAQDSAETLAEQARALDAEAHPTPPAGVPSPDVPGGVGGPLFAGVDDQAIPAVRIDVTNNAFTTAFSGAQVWGAAYDSVGDQVYFNDGATLMVWPVGGSISTIATITDASSGASLTMVGLAFYNGSLYGTRNIANEAIWQIDTTTAQATVFIDYADGDFDCGGFDADPATGEFYCTNDDSTPFGAGLYRMNPDGTGTQIAPYPAGQSDIDGLAIGDDGRAYLVTDDANGPIFVYDFGLAAYQTPLVNNWPTSEVFAAGAWIAAGGTAEIALAKTVGTVPNVCAATNEVAAPYGSTVYYCFTVTNTGTLALNSHDLVDSHLGTILDDFSYTLNPGESTYIVVSDVVAGDVTNTATWTASIVGGPSASAEATANVVALNTLAQIPTLSGVGLAALAVAMAAMALFLLARRRAT
ncbi:MAG: hypothetical protein KDB94_03260 [Acidobacteria bacterium]|nr:hypothetical protein [Acidobacteriota bacterium]